MSTGFPRQLWFTVSLLLDTVIVAAAAYGILVWQLSLRAAEVHYPEPAQTMASTLPNGAVYWLSATTGLSLAWPVLLLKHCLERRRYSLSPGELYGLVPLLDPIVVLALAALATNERLPEFFDPLFALRTMTLIGILVGISALGYVALALSSERRPVHTDIVGAISCASTTFTLGIAYLFHESARSTV